jgi:hypothetical protein
MSSYVHHTRVVAVLLLYRKFRFLLNVSTASCPFFLLFLQFLAVSQPPERRLSTLQSGSSSSSYSVSRRLGSSSTVVLRPSPLSSRSMYFSGFGLGSGRLSFLCNSDLKVVTFPAVRLCARPAAESLLRVPTLPKPYRVRSILRGSIHTTPILPFRVLARLQYLFKLPCCKVFLELAM